MYTIFTFLGAIGLTLWYIFFLQILQLDIETVWEKLKASGMTEPEIAMCQQVYDIIEKARELGIRHYDLQVNLDSDLLSQVSLVGLLVGCFGLNSPLRQYFSLYWAVSQREGERKEK